MSDDAGVVAYALAAYDNVAHFSLTSPAEVFASRHGPARRRRVSVAPDGRQLSAASTQPAVSGNGHAVAFRSSSAALVAHDTNELEDVFVRLHKFAD